MIPAVPSTATRSGLHNDVQHGIDQRHPVRQLAADAAATRGGGHRGAHSARDALGARHARGARLLERRGRRAHDARHALGACHMRDGRGPSRRINAAAPRGPPPRGPPPLGAASRLRHESMMAFEYWSLRGFVLEQNRFPGTKWSRGHLPSNVESGCRLPNMPIFEIHSRFGR